MKKILTRFKLNISSLFFRLMLYFSIMIIPIIIIGSITYVFSTNAMKNDFSNSIKLNMKASSNTIDIYVRTAQETSMSFLNNKSIRSILMPHNILSIDQKAELSEIPKNIAMNQNIVSEFIENIFVYLDDRKVYTREGMEEFKDFFEKFYVYEKYDITFWENLLDNERDFEILDPSVLQKPFTNTKKIVIPIVTVKKLGDNNATMVIDFSSDTILKTIKSNSTIKNTEFIVLDGRNNLIACSNNKYLDDINQISGIFKDGKELYAEIKLLNTMMLITYEKSDNLGWKYYSITPVSEFGKHSKGILNMTLLVCGILIIISIGLSFVFSMNLYSPIKNIRNILMNEYSISEPDKAKNEIEVIGIKIRDLLEDKNNYKNTLEKVSNEYSDNSFLNIIRGNCVEYDGTLKRILIEEHKFIHKYYICCNIQFVFKDEFYSDIQDTDRLNIIDGMKKIIWTMLDEKVPTYVLGLKKNLYVCIINLKDESEKEIVIKSVNNIIKCFKYDEKYYGIICGIGKIYTNLNDIRKSYNDAMSAIENVGAEGRNIQIVDSSSIQIVNKIYYSFTDEMKIVNCIKSSDKNNLIKVLEDIFNENRQKAVANNYIDTLTLEIYNTGIRYVAEMGLDIKQYTLNDNEFLNKNFDEKIQTLFNFFSRIIDNLAVTKENDIGTLPSMIIQYIKANYDKDIYLEKVAEEMGVSASYISKLFKQKTGINLTDYVSKIRIEKAKELLADTNLNMSDISGKVGIYSRTTFIRLFKKFEGVTPSDYREYCNRLR